MSADPISLWNASAEEPERSDRFEADRAVDVAIVGGGFTGLSTALHCAERGLEAQVLEARQIGFGGSGRNCGLVNAALWLPPQEIRRRLGDTYGPRFVERFGKGPEIVFSLIEKHQMCCEATRTGTIHAAHSKGGYRELEGRAAEWRRLGEPVELLDRAAVTTLVGSDAFFGGLLDHRAGTINPMGYCRGLARAARGAGATIVTGVRATGLQRHDAAAGRGRRWRVETERGTLHARSVVLGTNAYTDGLWPDLKRVFTPIHYFQLATAPLGEEAAHVLPGRHGLWDTGRIMFNVRRDARDRVLLGSMGTVHGGTERGLTQRWARRRLRRLFPGLGAVTFEEAWHGRIAMTPDHLPRIHEPADGLYTAIGYNGRGITTGTLFGQALAELLTGTPARELPLPITALATVPSAPFAARLLQSAFTANQLVRSV